MVTDRSNYGEKSSENPREGLLFCFALVLQVCVGYSCGNVQQQVDKLRGGVHVGTINL